MSGEVSEFPQFQQQLVPAPREPMWSPGLSQHATPTNAHHPTTVYSNEDLARPTTGLRRRPSQPPRRYSGGDYDYKPSFAPDRHYTLRPRDDLYFDDREPPRVARRADDYNAPPHPDAYERSRPPRTYRNVEGWERRPTSARYDDARDLEKGMTPDGPVEWAGGERGPNLRKIDSDSVDGYNYDLHKKNHRATIDLNSLTKEERQMVMRLPWTAWMNSSFKNHFVATVGEFVGTTMFLFFAFAGTQVANIGSTASNTTTGATTGFNIAVELYIAVIFGFSLMVNVWVFFRISGGLFNPAVTLGMVLVGALPIVRAICLFCAQIAGGIAASGMVFGLFPTTFNVRTTLSDGTSIVRGVFIEAILTAELVFTIFMLAKEKHKATFIAPVGIGLALFIAEMVGVYYTGGSLNPARSFGPCVVSGTFDTTHWIYWVGPSMGSLIAVFFYKFIKMLEYEMANPGQDGDSANDPTQSEQKRSAMLEERAKRYEKRHNNGSGSISIRPGSRFS